MLNPELATSFKYHRRAHKSVATAVALARKDVAAQTHRHYYPRGRYFEDGRKPSDSLWFERENDVGLRFVKFADECGLRSINHKGWYTNNTCDGDKYRGCVLRLSSRHRVERFIAAYADPNNDGAYCLDLSRGAIFDSENDAAMAADAFAGRNAEDEREYNAAWQAGYLYSERANEIADARKQILALLAERRSVRGQADKPAICDAIKWKVERCLKTIQEARDERAKLAAGDFISEWLPGFYRGDKRLLAAFNEGSNS